MSASDANQDAAHARNPRSAATQSQSEAFFPGFTDGWSIDRAVNCCCQRIVLPKIRATARDHSFRGRIFRFQRWLWPPNGYLTSSREGLYLAVTP